MIPSKRYSPLNWYWVVGDDMSRVWSSNRSSYFPSDDTLYQEWLKPGRKPTRINNEVELIEVLSKYGLTGPGVIP